MLANIGLFQVFQIIYSQAAYRYLTAKPNDQLIELCEGYCAHPLYSWPRGSGPGGGCRPVSQYSTWDQVKLNFIIQ
jgi:hypothetical protein